MNGLTITSNRGEREEKWLAEKGGFAIARANDNRRFGLPRFRFSAAMRRGVRQTAER